MPSGALRHQRYIGLSNPSTHTDLGHFVFFSADQIGLQPAGDTSHYGFATGRTQVLSAKRYVHGGVSMQEMLIPCVVFVPTAKGQLEILPSQ